MRIRTRLVVVGALAAAALLVLGGVASAQTSEEQLSEEITQDLGQEEKDCVEILFDGGTVDDCQEAPSPILPAANELIWGVLFFAVVAWLLIKFAFPALKESMKAREDKIRDDLESAESARTEAEGQLTEYQRQLAEARNEAARIVEESREAADQVRRDIIARAESDAAELRGRADEDIRLASERAMSDLQARVGELAIELAEKIVERNLDRDTQMALVESYIRDVASSN